jgi:acyl dehydratase
MAKQTYWEDVETGSEVPTLQKNPTTQQLVKYAGASGDFYQIHYDKDFALNNNLPGVILHGALKNGFLGQMMTDFAATTDGSASSQCSIAGWTSRAPGSCARARW